MNTPTRLLSDPADCLPIAAVERDTGLLKDTLRVWERRYGFPRPLRDSNDERIYPQAQVEQLRQIKRLLDQGWRPGKLFALAEPDLQALLTQSAEPIPLPPELEALLEMISARDTAALRSALSTEVERLGLQAFVTTLATPLCIAVGEAWARGEFDIAHEHFYTEALQNQLRQSIGRFTSTSARPRVLLTTLPDELHSLGLLLAEAMLAPTGIPCASLGAQTPLVDIIRVMQDDAFDIIILSFSPAFPLRQAINSLQELAARIPGGSTIWVGSRQLADKGPAISGVRYLASIEETLQALAEWQANRAS